LADLCRDSHVSGEWEPDAENWVRWARTPDFDAYWYFRDRFFDEILPAAGTRMLEIGCGEGRVARDLVARGHDVVALDTSSTLVAHAHEADDRSTYLVAGGAALPFRDASFDVVVAYNSLQVVDDMATTVREAARVLRNGGSLCACTAHPVTDLGRPADNGWAIRDDYFDSRRVDDRVEREGFVMTFRGWTYSLEHYSRALEDAGLRIDRLREPRPSLDSECFGRWNAVPLFLNFRATKR
jgi:ubiquinone/menaquinone biosynthesis C-methylase UbiE